jgi:hypothetical protein
MDVEYVEDKSRVNTQYEYDCKWKQCDQEVLLSCSYIPKEFVIWAEDCPLKANTWYEAVRTTPTRTNMR